MEQPRAPDNARARAGVSAGEATHKEQRRPALDGFRGLAALVVISFHVYQATWPGLKTLDAPALLQNAFAHAGDIAVDAFFVLSGFLLLGPFLVAACGYGPWPNIRRYVAARALRILPAWWVCLTVVVLVSNRHLLPQLGELALLASLQHTFDGALLRNVVPPTWTLHIEIWAYALIPIAAFVALRLARIARQSHRPLIVEASYSAP